MPYRRSYSSATRSNMYGHMNLASAPSWSVQAAAPRCCGRQVAVHRLLEFDPDDERRAVRPRSKIGHRRQSRDAARRASGLVTRRRRVPEAVVHGGGHRAEVTLAGEHLAERVGEVDDLDVGGVHVGRGESGVDDLGGQVGEVASLAGEVAGEVALIAAENPDVGSAHAATLLQLRELLGEFTNGSAPPARGLNRRDLGVRSGRPPRAPVVGHCPVGENDKRSCIGQSDGGSLVYDWKHATRTSRSGWPSWRAPPPRRAASATCLQTSPRRRRN